MQTLTKPFLQLMMEWLLSARMVHLWTVSACLEASSLLLPTGCCYRPLKPSDPRLQWSSNSFWHSLVEPSAQLWSGQTKELQKEAQGVCMPPYYSAALADGSNRSASQPRLHCNKRWGHANSSTLAAVHPSQHQPSEHSPFHLWAAHWDFLRQDSV